MKYNWDWFDSIFITRIENQTKLHKSIQFYPIFFISFYYLTGLAI